MNTTTTAAAPVHLTAATFDAAVASSHDRPVLVDFWATWCGPCKAQAPILDELATQQGDRAVIAKLDVDEAPEIASRLQIRSIPTLIVFRHGQPVSRFVGIQSGPTLARALAAAAT